MYRNVYGIDVGKHWFHVVTLNAAGTRIELRGSTEFKSWRTSPNCSRASSRWKPVLARITWAKS